MAEMRAAFSHFGKAPRKRGLGFAVRCCGGNGPRFRPRIGVIAGVGCIFGTGAKTNKAPRARFRSIGRQRSGSFQPIGVFRRGPKPPMGDIPGGMDDDGGAEILDQALRFILAQ
jgi:hypothetical protein